MFLWLLLVANCLLTWNSLWN